MPPLERRISLRGPRFYIAEAIGPGRVIMFCNQIDGSTRDGPRLATEDDQAAFPDAWKALAAEVESEPVAPLQRITVHTPDPDDIPAPVKRQVRQATLAPV